jgi:hypothetical protein
MRAELRLGRSTPTVTIIPKLIVRVRFPSPALSGPRSGLVSVPRTLVSLEQLLIFLAISAFLDTPSSAPSSACQRPGHGHDVKGVYGVAFDRFAALSRGINTALDAVTAHQGFGVYEEEGRNEAG